MTIFRSKKNGMLYLIGQCQRWLRDYTAEPYGHFTPAPTRSKSGPLVRKVNLRDFEAVGYR